MNDIPSSPDQKNTKAIGLHQDRNPKRQKIGKSWFLGIGINDYQYFTPLKNAVKDVKDIAITLLDQYMLDPDHTITLLDKNATRENIINTLEDLANNKIQPEDKFLLYFSGHGHFNKRTELGYWIPQDAEKDKSSSYISNSTIRDYIKAIRAFHTLLIADSCFAGMFFTNETRSLDSAIDDLERRRSRWGIVSGREKVSDGEPCTNSPFAVSILNELQSNRADKLNVALLADKVVKLTRANSKQLPEGCPLYDVGHDGGQYIFHLASSEKNCWERCLSDPSLKTYNHYLELFPHGPHAPEALQRIEEIEEEMEWQDALGINKTFRYRAFLKSFPSGKYATEARRSIRNLHRKTEEKNLWTQAEEKNTQEEYEKYLSRYPTGEFAAQAKNRIQELEHSDRQAALEKAIEQAWQQACAQNSVELYTAFIHRFPEHPYAKSAQRRIDQRKVAEQSNYVPYLVNVKPDDLIPTPKTKDRPNPRSRKYSLYALGSLLPVFFLVWIWFSLSKNTGSTEVTEPTFPKKDSVELGGKPYLTIQFKPDSLVWMAQNLDYDIAGADYHNQLLVSERKKYGRLYTWEAAQEACKAIGWRLPTRFEWQAMAGYFGWTSMPSDTVASARKAASLALIYGGESGFGARLGGSFNPDGQFADLHSDGDYWTGDENGFVYAWSFSFSREGLQLFQYTKDWGFSCRCVKGKP